jgi:hypothetical protein
MKKICPPDYRVTSISLYSEDEKNLDEIKKHLSSHSQSPAIRYALKMTAESLTKPKGTK